MCVCYIPGDPQPILLACWQSHSGEHREVLPSRVSLVWYLTPPPSLFHCVLTMLPPSLPPSPPLSLCAHNATSLPPSLPPSLTVCSQCYLPPSLPPPLSHCVLTMLPPSLPPSPPLSLCAHNATSLPPSLPPSLTVCSQCYLPPSLPPSLTVCSQCYLPLSLPPSLTVCSQCPGAATPLCTTCWKRLRRTEWRASFSAKPANTSTWYVRPENSDMRSCIFSSILAQYHSPHTLLNCDAIIIVPINRSILMQCSPVQLFDTENVVNQQSLEYMFTTEGHLIRLDPALRARRWQERLSCEDDSQKAVARVNESFFTNSVSSL